MKLKNQCFVLSMLAILVFTACSLDDDGNNFINTSALGIVFNASPDSENLTFFADRNRVNSTPLDFNEGQGYFRFFSGNRDISIVNSDGDELASENVQLQTQNYYSIFAVDSLSNASVFVIRDSLSTPANGQFRVRFIHLSPDAPEVNFSVGDTNLGSFEFKDFSEFTGIDGGTFDLKITDTSGNEVLVEEDVLLQTGRIYTYLAVGLLGADSEADNALQLRRITNFRN